MALRTAGRIEASHRQAQNVELVWTGPEAEFVSSA